MVGNQPRKGAKMSSRRTMNFSSARSCQWLCSLGFSRHWPDCLNEVRRRGFVNERRWLPVHRSHVPGARNSRRWIGSGIHQTFSEYNANPFVRRARLSLIFCTEPRTRKALKLFRTLKVRVAALGALPSRGFVAAESRGEARCQPALSTRYLNRRLRVVLSPHCKVGSWVGVAFQRHSRAVSFPSSRS